MSFHCESQIISEEQFRIALYAALKPYQGRVRSVTGPGRSGALASVYASYFLQVPWFIIKASVEDYLRPILLVDTAIQTGKTLRKAQRRMGAEFMVAVFQEPPRVHFWYEYQEARQMLHTGGVL